MVHISLGRNAPRGKNNIMQVELLLVHRVPEPQRPQLKRRLTMKKENQTPDQRVLKESNTMKANFRDTSRA